MAVSRRGPAAVPSTAPSARAVPPGEPDAATTPGGTLVVDDTFRSTVGRGRLYGTPADVGGPRLGADAEGTLAVDGDELRIGALQRPGWGRSCVSYGPVAAEPGLGLVVHVLNGHQASQSYSLRRLVPRIGEWLRGSGATPMRARVWRILTDGRRISSARRLRGWARRTGGSDSPISSRVPALARLRTLPGDEPPFVDNLAAGWFRAGTAASIADVAAGFVVRSASNLNGELGVVTDGRFVPAFDRLAAVPLHLVAIHRADSTLYAVSSLPGTLGAAEHPAMRPLLIAPPVSVPTVHPAVQQNVSGEIGFSIDTRVLGIRVVRDETLAARHHGAHAADVLVGAGPLGGDRPAIGAAWRVTGSGIDRGPDGAVARGSDATALIDPGAPSGIIRVTATASSRIDAAVMWRAVDEERHVRLVLRDGRWQLIDRTGRDEATLGDGALPGGEQCIQIVDDGASIRLLAGSTVLCTVDALSVDGATTGTGVGLAAVASGPLGIATIEALPVAMPIPASLALPAAPTLPSGSDVVIEDRFDTASADLDGRSVDGLRTWRRELGAGRIASDPERGAHVVEAPGRTAYTVPWREPRFADLTTVITPVGGPEARCRAGLVFLQDADNYLSLNLWFNDRPDGAASVSSFFMIDGFEDVYDAVWVNVFDRVQWDRPVEMRAAFDGALYQVWLDGEPVLWRRIRDVYPAASRLAIRRVGLLSNWEWGLDTGSRFRSFVART